MDDRDKDLTHLFVRDLDAIPLPERGLWRSHQRRESIVMRATRLLAAAGAVAAVLVLALVIGQQLRQRTSVAGPDASASAVPSTTPAPSSSPGASTSPGASPSGTAPAAQSASSSIANDDFGFVVATSNGNVGIRRESSETRIGSLTARAYAVSPDGKQIAFFSSTAPKELRTTSASDPSKSELVLTLIDGDGGDVVWASDGQALLYSVVHTTGAGTTSDMRTFELRPVSREHLIYASTTPGVVLQPIAWDRASQQLAFGETGEGGFMAYYDVTHFNTGGPDPVTTRAAVPVQIVMHTVQATTDARFVLGYDLTARGFAYWPLQTMSGAGRHPPESKYGNTGAIWRPGTHEIGFIGPSDQFWLCDVDKDNSGPCGRTAFSGVPQGGQVRSFRADGSAVLLAVPGNGSAPTSYTLVRLVPEDPKATTGDRITFQDVSGVGPSVRLR